MLDLLESVSLRSGEPAPSRADLNLDGFSFAR